MREGWKIRKLGDFCSIKSGKAIDAKEISLVQTEGSIPCYGGNGVRGFVKTKIGDGILPIIGRVGALCGNVQITGGPFYATEHALVVSISDTSISPLWLKLALLSMNLRQYAKGVAQPVLSARELESLLLPVPTVQEQKRIVAELDCLSEVNAKKKQQLEGLDKLAQSIFYDMFGSPIANEKGWEQKRLEELISIGVITYHLDGNHGGSYPRNEEFVDKGVAYIGANCIENGSVNLHLAKHLSVERANTLRKGIAKNNDILFAHNATVGPVAILKTTDERIILSTSLTAFRCNPDLMSPLFLRAYMCSEWFIPQYKGIMKQSTRNQIPISQQKKMYFILPPIDLQDRFAQKIEAIEKQKELVKLSIVETDTLLNSRMDYWFNR